jgi:DCN1-like protein 1/2
VVQDLLRDLLAAFYQAYLEDATEPRRRRMAALLLQADQHGLLGPAAVQSLAMLFSSLVHEFALDPQKFAAFYHFFFFVSRDRGHRNLTDATAVEGWRFLLGNGRFGLLEPWCAFVARRGVRGVSKGVSEDTWCQVLDFAHASNNAGGGLDAYDPHGAWPVLVDEFVDEMRAKEGLGPCRSERGGGDTAMDERGRTGGTERGSSAVTMSSVPTAMDQSFDASDASMVYNGGTAGGSGLGFGAADRWAGSGGRVDARGGEGDGRVPAVGCKRRLSAVLELDWARGPAGEAGEVLDPSGAHRGCGARGDDDTEPHDGIAHEEIL